MSQKLLSEVPSDCLTAAEIAERKGVSLASVYWAMKHHKVRTYRQAGRRYVPAADVESWFGVRLVGGVR